MAVVGLQGAICNAIIDTGACKSLIDRRLAEAMRLPIEVAQNNDWGTYIGAGAMEKAYYGGIRGPINVRFDGMVNVALPYLRVIDHSHPILLIGADILRSSHASPGLWHFGGVVNKPTPMEFRSYLIFGHPNYEDRAIQLASCPGPSSVGYAPATS